MGGSTGRVEPLPSLFQFILLFKNKKLFESCIGFIKWYATYWELCIIVVIKRHLILYNNFVTTNEVLYLWVLKTSFREMVPKWEIYMYIQLLEDDLFKYCIFENLLKICWRENEKDGVFNMLKPFKNSEKKQKTKTMGHSVHWNY